MSLTFACGDALIARQEEIRQLFAGLPLEEVERRRACMLKVKDRFYPLGNGPFQYLNLCIEHAESLIIASAVSGEVLSEENIRTIEDNAAVDTGAVLETAHRLLGGFDDPTVIKMLDDATINYATTDC
jgi:hypothetical protein